MVGRQQARVASDNPVPVMIGIASEGDVEAILEANQTLHGVGRGRVHANPAVPVNAHEAEGRIDGFVHHRQIQTIALGNRAPIMHPGATQRIHAQTDVRAANRLHVEHVAEIADVGVEIVVAVRRGDA